MQALRVVVVLVVSLLLCSTGTYAQDDGPTFYLGGGIANPMSPDEFADYYKTGYTFGAGIGIPLGQSGKLSAVGTVDYNRFSINKNRIFSDIGISGAGIAVSGGTATVLSISGNGKLKLGSESKAIPYLIAGVGFFRFSASDATVTGNGLSVTVTGETENKLGIGAGAGVDISLNEKMAMFIEARYNVGFTKGDKTHFLPLKVGLSFH